MEYHFPTGIEIPVYLLNSMTVASLSFVAAVFLLLYFFNKNLHDSLKIGVLLVLWYGLVYILGIQGFFGATILNVPMISIGFVMAFVLLRTLYKNPFIERVFEKIPIHFLIGIQVFRLMGYGFLTFYGLGLIPGAFALPTGYGDVFIGFTAPFVAYLVFMNKAKQLAIWWNYLGILDLALALILGTATYPRPLQLLSSTPNNELIALFPLVMVPLFAVPLSILLHLFTLKALREKLA